MKPKPRTQRPRDIKNRHAKSMASMHGASLICLGDDSGWFYVVYSDAKKLHAWLTRAIKYLEQK